MNFAIRVAVDVGDTAPQLIDYMTIECILI